MSVDQTDYDLRQFRLMSATLDDFMASRLQLATFIRRMEGLINAVEGFSVERRNTFLKHWGVFEDVYAATLDQRQSRVPEEFEGLIDTAVARLRCLVAEEVAALDRGGEAVPAIGSVLDR